jgi:hypothetical protein
MFRFTIRDLLWLMVVVAICSAWFSHVRSIRQSELRRAEELLKEVKASLREQSERAAKLGIQLPARP